MKNLRISLLGLFIASIAIIGCSDGEDGMDGAPGTANVKGSTYTIMGTDWTNGNATITVPGLTRSIAENGQVAVYFTLDSLGTDTITWNPLPYRFVGNVGGQAQFITIQNTVSIGKEVISARLNNNGGVNFGAETNARVILIHSSSRVSGVNHDNYEEVLEVYGIKENEL